MLAVNNSMSDSNNQSPIHGSTLNVIGHGRGSNSGRGDSYACRS